MLLAKIEKVAPVGSIGAVSIFGKGPKSEIHLLGQRLFVAGSAVAQLCVNELPAHGRWIDEKASFAVNR